MGANVFSSYPLGQIMGDSLDQASRVHQDESRAVLLGQFDDAVVNFIPHFVAGDGPKQRGRNFHREVELALVTDVDDYRIGPAVSREKMGYLLNWFLRCRKSDANRRAMGQCLQPLERQRQMRTAL